ncbi:hypothetical protein [Alloalcanivorax venustensis]|jgi:hypothetical protein|uniref:hypothetical protein n=1 Tax=Alloalcanivorax venustensis TaxID=172371 RepID=UPI0039C251C5|tara:strand:- start:47 stop:694 length:648 start_codon:yes stop_codon:yes gene_type:complete
MNDVIGDEDALKSIDRLHLPDPRNKHFSIEYWHGCIAEIKISDRVPVSVRQIFENAKNIALYSYYSYRLHQAAEIIGYMALESSLKEKYELVGTRFRHRRPKSFKDYIKIALVEGWVSDERMVSFRAVAESAVRERLTRDMIHSGLVGKEPVPSPTPSEEEILAELRAMRVAEKALHGKRRIRNMYLHEGTGLSDTSVEVLTDLAELINQIFEEN